MGEKGAENTGKEGKNPLEGIFRDKRCQVSKEEEMKNKLMI